MVCLMNKRCKTFSHFKNGLCRKKANDFFFSFSVSNSDTTCAVWGEEKTSLWSVLFRTFLTVANCSVHLIRDVQGRGQTKIP